MLLRLTQLILAAIATAAAGGGTPAPVPARAVRPTVQPGVVEAYAALHAAGLRVSIPARIDIVLPGLDPEPVVLDRRPRAGVPLRPGSIVTLRIGSGVGGVGSPGVSVPEPRYTVPDFRGRPVSDAYAWLTGRALDWSAYLGPLRAGRAATLYDNYRVVRQWPAPGSSLTAGVGGRSGNTGFFRVTPLTVWGMQAG